MAEKTSGVYKLVTIPSVYEAFQNLLGGLSARRAFRDEFFPDVAGKSVLEVGCGPGTWFPEMEGCASYLGMDWNEEHIEQANERFGSETTRFVCGDVSKDISADQQQFDYIFAFGILHHLDDKQAAALMSVCSALLSPASKFLSIDPVYHEGQNRFAKWMCDRDSGQDIRTETGYRALADEKFGSVSTTVCTDKLRIPYSHCVMVANRT